MSKQQQRQESILEASAAFDARQLHELSARLISSGVLGRSRHYQRLLEFLVECAIEQRTPRELDIALEALGKNDDFDVASDSTVRVYMHQLRKKLDSYYQEHEKNARYRLTIPKGQYRLAVREMDSQLAAGGNPVWQRVATVNTSLLLVIGLLLLANLVYLMRGDATETRNPALQLATHPVWQTVLADDQPLLLVMGDYYIFGELNANGNVARMVREFNVNSSSDLEELRFSDVERAENYLDLDLSYMPEGSAFALSRIVPILESSNKPVSITMMSDLTMADIRSNHIVYVGYVSALDKLMELSFSGSDLRVGRSFDELVNMETAEYYISDAGLPEQGQRFRDYGLFATYPVSADTQVILISGMRDAGVMHTAQALSDFETLNSLIAALESDTDEAVSSFEALFEVYGVDRMNFDAQLVHAAQVDREAKWQLLQEPVAAAEIK